MSEHLTKAKSALARARELTDECDLDDEQHIANRNEYARVLDIALIQAHVAVADAMTRIADVIAPKETDEAPAPGP